MLIPTHKLWMLLEKPDDRNGDGGSGDEDDVDDEDVVDDDETEDEDDVEYRTPFEAKLAKEHPELLKEYQDTTSGLHSALQKERQSGKDARTKLKAYTDKEDEDARAQRTKEENLESDLAAATARADAAEKRAKTLEQETLVRKVATGMNFQNPDDAVKFVDMGSLEIGEDEAANEKAVKDALTAIVKDRKYLIKSVLGDDDNDTDTRRHRKLDDDPASRKKIKKEQPKIAI